LFEIDKLSRLRLRRPDGINSRGRGRRVIFGDVEASKVFAFLCQFMPDSNIESVLGILGDFMPIHMAVTILGNPDNIGKLLVGLCDERQINRANFGNQSIGFGVLQVARQGRGGKVMGDQDNLESVEGSSCKFMD
jgi:hypothetical protein